MCGSRVRALASQLGRDDAIIDVRSPATPKRSATLTTPSGCAGLLGTLSGIERHFRETPAARLAAREKQSQQHFRPVISVHKWFARRPGTLFRALVLAELAETPTDTSLSLGHQLHGVALDPFMGGGTPLIEASRLGLSVVGYDTNPVARWIVERELEDLDPDALAAAGERAIARVERKVRSLYVTECPGCGHEAPVRYFMWVRQHACACGVEHALLSDTMLVSSKMGRHPADVHVCPSCLKLAEHPSGERPDHCPDCSERYDTGLVPARALVSCDCGLPYRIPPNGEVQTPSHRLLAIQYHCDTCANGPAQRMFKAADAADLRRITRAQRALVRSGAPAAPTPTELIPAGDETRRLLRWGYNAWRDLFEARQLHGVSLLAESVCAEPDPRLRAALITCVSDLLRYQNVLCRYDRQALKSADIFAVHGFPVPRVFCEPHLLGSPTGEGSGGFRHILAKYVRAKRWCRDPYETTITPAGRLTRTLTGPEKVAAEVGSARAQLRCGSIGACEVGEGTVDLVLTDPPYFANVQYAQLTDFSYAWLRRMAPEVPYFQALSTRTEQDAVGGSDVDLAEFARRLSEVYVRAAQALKPSGPFCFTYHHNELAAYAPVVMACLDAGLVPVRAYACPTEMRASTHIHGNRASTVDAVFMLRKPPVPGVASPRFDGRWLRRRLEALTAAGVKATDADRACLEHTGLAMRAIRALADSWDPDAPVRDRLDRTLEALGLPARTPLVVR